MAEHPDHTTTTGAASMTDDILSVLTAEEPHGATADQIARVIGLGLTGEVVQDELEELVMRGILDRRGIGLGAVYTLAARM